MDRINRVGTETEGTGRDVTWFMVVVVVVVVVMMMVMTVGNLVM